MAKIKITQPTYNRETKEHYKVGDIIDLGGIRNKRAVDTKQAVWVTTKELAKEEAKADNTENTTEKVEQTQGAKKTTSSARGKRIETKNKPKIDPSKVIISEPIGVDQYGNLTDKNKKD